jgi:hypothetical protein
MQGLHSLFHLTDGTILFSVYYKLFCPYLILLSRLNAKRFLLTILQDKIRIKNEKTNLTSCFSHEIIYECVVITLKH